MILIENVKWKSAHHDKISVLILILHRCTINCIWVIFWPKPTINKKIYEKTTNSKLIHMKHFNCTNKKIIL